jgi:hypothetical protein
MPLINCSACGRQISTEAEACPQCGHPNRTSTRAPAGPRCYGCSAAATTRCQSCSAFSCARHLQSIFVSHGKGGAYELRCEGCYSSAQAWQVFGWIVGGIVILVFLVVLFTVILPQKREFDQKWDQRQREHQEFRQKFDREWDQRQREHQEFRQKHGFGP